ncbi:MAG: alcohol dehydrogenase catalytic domain-containing protein, partial [Alphaproteobacteria bacterium]|nr:alcohol dehydrogenase catalytic domain-containing protein [Alphaproteobacteria bacterium]
MTAIEISQFGPADVLRPGQVPLPQINAGEVLVKVAAAGVNRPDIMQRRGLYPAPAGASTIPGLEIAGEIVKIGPDVTHRAIGEQICALVTGGGYSEYCAAPASQCLPIPRGLSLKQAAALPETFFTVWSNVFDRGRLKTGEIFMVHGGTSGIGTTAIQLAKARGAIVITTAGTADKAAFCS